MPYLYRCDPLVENRHYTYTRTPLKFSNSSAFKRESGCTYEWQPFPSCRVQGRGIRHNTSTHDQASQLNGLSKPSLLIGRTNPDSSQHKRTASRIEFGVPQKPFSVQVRHGQFRHGGLMCMQRASRPLKNGTVEQLASKFCAL